MNTKTTKFLAVLAVLAMAFAAVAIVAPAQGSDAGETATVNVYTDCEDTTDVTEIDGESAYYFSEDASVKVTSLADATAIYVNNGVTIELRFGSDESITASTITIVTVSGDRGGKTVWSETQIIFTPEKKTNFQYEAAKITETSSFYPAIDTSDKYAYFAYNGVFDEDATFGANTAISSGEEVIIATTSDSTGEWIVPGFNYGILYTAVINEEEEEEITYTLYYTAAKASLGNIDLTEWSVYVKSGSVTAKNGTANSVAVSGIVGAAFWLTVEDTIVMEGAINAATAGSITLNGEVALNLTTSNSKTISASVTLTVAKKATVTTTGTIYNYGTIYLRNSGGIVCNNTPINNDTSGVIYLENSDLWTYYNEGCIVGGGLIDTRAISEKLTGSTGSVKTLNVDVGQVMTLDGDVKVTESLTVDGILIVSAGVTLTINAGAVMAVSGNLSVVENYGTIDIYVDHTAGEYNALYNALSVEDNAKFVNDGALNAKSAKADAVKNVALNLDTDKFVNNGTISVGNYDIATFSSLVNNGAITINGQVSGGLVNKGTVTFARGAELVGDLEITAKSATSVVSVTQLTLGFNNESAATYALTVTADNYSSKIKSYGTSVSISSDSDASALKVQNIIIAGAKYTPFSTSYAALDISGTVIVPSVLKVDQTNATLTVEASGNVIVSDNLTMSKYTNLNITNEGNYQNFVVQVGATLTVQADAAISIAEETGEDAGDAANFTVNGTAIIYNVNNNMTGAPTTGVAYATAASVITITDFETALAGAIAAEIDTITVYGGYNNVTGPITVPAGMLVTGDDDAGLYLLAGTLEVDSDAILDVTVSIYRGTVHSYNYSVISDVTSDVMIESDDSDEITYMDMYTALATIDGVVELREGVVVVVTEDLVIPAGVTLDVTEAGLLIYGTSLTINGTLLVDELGAFALDEDGYIAGTGFDVMDSHIALASITVNGYYDAIDNTIGSDEWWYPAGILYETVDDDEYTHYVITSIDNMATAIALDEDAEITITGNTEIEDLTIAGSSDKVVTVIFAGDVDAGTITLVNAIVNLADNEIIAATFADANGAIVLKNAKATKLVIDATDGLLASGKVGDIIYETSAAGIPSAKTAYSASFVGAVAVSGFTADYDSTTVYDKDTDGTMEPEVSVVGELTADYSVSRNTYFLTDIVVLGVFSAEDQSRVFVEGDAEVLGSIVTDDSGQITINGDLFVGTYEDDLFDEPETQAVASIIGNITVPEGLIYALTGTVVDEDVVEDMYHVDIAVEDIVYITIYSNDDDLTVEYIIVPITDAVILDVQDEDGETIDAVSVYDPEGIISIDTLDLETYDYINVVVNEYIYTVAIKTDAGVKSVALDGMVMLSSPAITGENFFYLENLAAGTYTVSYTLKAGYEGTPTLSTEMGTVLKGYDIAIGGDYDEQTIEELDVDVIYQLTGTEKEVTPEPVTPEEKEEWTITTILLVILVILIAIMAVIVALRLNRS